MMKKLVLAAIALFAAPAMAQSAPTDEDAMHDVHAGHDEAAAKFTLDTPIAAIAGDENGRAILDADLPGLTSHPHYEMFKGMSLNQLAPMAGDQIPAEALARVKEKFSKIQ